MATLSPESGAGDGQARGVMGEAIQIGEAQHDDRGPQRGPAPVEAHVDAGHVADLTGRILPDDLWPQLLLDGDGDLAGMAWREPAHRLLIRVGRIAEYAGWAALFFLHLIHSVAVSNGLGYLEGDIGSRTG